MVELIASTIFSGPRNVYFATRSTNGTIAPHAMRFTDNGVGLPVADPLLYLYALRCCGFPKCPLGQGLRPDRHGLQLSGLASCRVAEDASTNHRQFPEPPV